MITTAVIVLYYFWWFVRPFLSNSVGFNQGAGLQTKFPFPPLELLEAIVFTGFAGLSLILTLGIFGYRSNFKPADVDVLFPTPVNPRTVLVFRMVRDYLATLIIPILLVLISWKQLPLEELFRSVPHPQSAGYAVRALSLGFILITTAWVGIGYAVSLYVNRNDRRSELRKQVFGWAIAVPCLAVVGFTVSKAVKFHGVAEFVAYAHQTWLRAFFFTATPATKIVMGPLEGDATETVVGALTLILISLGTLLISLRQSAWMYDQAAVRGFGAESLRQMQRKGDLVGAMAEATRRSKKLKPRKWGWFQRLKMQGFGALLWKDALIQWRTIRGMVVIFSIVGLTLVAMPYFAGVRSRQESIGYLVLVMEGFVAFMVATMTSQTGFTELLRRVDLQKPLPFGPQKIVISEVLAKALPAIFVPILCSIVGVILFPAAWRDVIAGAIFFPSLAAVICALVCVIVLLFPEIDDVSQRGFRGLMMMLGLLIVGTPGVLTFIGIGALSSSTIVGSVPGAIVNLFVAFGLTMVGGSLYAGFNPSE